MPPPPPPMPARGGPGPPPPPPPPSGSGPSRPPAAVAQNRGALLGDIAKGRKLNKTVTNDRSAPATGNASKSSGGPVSGAPPVPGMGMGLPPGSAPIPPPAARSRASSNVASGDSSAQPPQLGGLFAGGGMPKLRKSGGVKTGAETDSPYMSENDAAPRIPSAPRLPSAAPPPLPRVSAPTPAVSALRDQLRPPLGGASSTSDLPTGPSSFDGAGRKKPPVVGKKPAIPVPSTGRSPSASFSKPPTAPPPPPSQVAPTAVPPPLPPPSLPRTANSTSAVPQKSKSPALGSGTMPPPPPPPPPSQPTTAPPVNLAAQAAINAMNRATPQAPPPRPPSQAPVLPPPSSPPSRPPPGPISLQPTSSIDRSSMSASSYTLSNGNSNNVPRKSVSRPSITDQNGSGQSAGHLVIQDSRWKFQPDDQLPKPRDFVGGVKNYRAGRVSTVPLDLRSYE